jgi:hypothetical protein
VIDFIQFLRGGVCMKKELGMKKKHNDSPSVEEYLRMDETEKEISIQKAVIRLQTRIQEILYLMESEIKSKQITHKKEGEKDGHGPTGC